MWEKLHIGLVSPRTRAGWLLGTSDALTLTITTLAFMAGAALAIGVDPRSTGRLILVASTGVFSAFVVSLRILNEGLQLSAESERYEWCLASVESLNRRFEIADAKEELELLRDMERLAYQEMCRFLVSFKKARFVM